MWLVIDTLELSGTSDSFPHRTENTIKTTNHTINIFMALCDHCPYFFRLPRSGSDIIRGGGKGKGSLDSEDAVIYLRH
jgi:hypothetical protein